MKKLVSLLLALVMTLGACTSAIAETNGGSEDVQTGNETYTMETVLAGVDALTGNEAEKTAIKNYLNTYFVVADNENGVFVVINNVGLRQDKFIQTQEQKATVQNAVDGYNAQIGDTNRSIAAILNTYQVKYGNGTRTFENLMGMYTAALKRPAVQINEGSNGPDTGKVKGTHLLKSSDGTDYPYNNAEYITAADANAAIEYFNEYFTYRTWELKDGNKYNTVTYSDSIYDKETDKITDEAKAKEAITEYNNLAPAVQVSLNELEIRVATGPNGTEQFRFWRLIQRFDKQLNGSQGGNQGHGPDTGSVTSLDELFKNDDIATQKAKAFLNTYIVYEYKDQEYSDIHIKETTIGTNRLFTDTAKARAAINGYDAMVREMEGTRNVLDNLRIRVDDELWRFSRRMEYYRSLVQMAEAKGDSTVKTDPLNSEDTVATALKRAGFTAPTLGSDFTISFPSALERGVDYNYNYTTDTGVGILTVEVYKGEKEHWIQAAMENPEGVRYRITLRNARGLGFYGQDTGNGNSGLWDNWAAGEVQLSKRSTTSTDQNNIGMAAVNQRNGVITVNAIENYGEMMVVSAWGNAAQSSEGVNAIQLKDAVDPVKHLLLIRIRVVDQFTYEAEGQAGVQTVDVTDTYRVKLLNVNEEQWTVTRVAGTITLRPRGERKTLADMGTNSVGTLTVNPPAQDWGLQSATMSSGNSTQDVGGRNQDGSWTCPRFFPYENNGKAVSGARVFTLVWQSPDGKGTYAEKLTVSFAEQTSQAVEKLGAKTIMTVITPSESTVNNDKQALGNNSGINVDYDPALGSFRTTFDDSTIPSVADLSKGLVMEPSEDIKSSVKGFHEYPFEMNSEPDNLDSDWASKVISALRAEHGDSERTKTYPDNTVARTIPFVATNSVTHGDMTVYFAFTQAYRGKVIEWVDEENNVLGYTFAYGRNDPFVATTRTEVKPGGEDGRPTGEPGNYNEPFAVGPGGGMFWCERYPQEGGNGQKWYFRLRVSGRQQEGGPYTVYLPYGYLGISEQEAQRLINSGRKARIDHYVNGDGMAPETLEGTYTEWGICFKTRSFSPFVISTAAQSSSGGGYYYGGASTPGISAVKTADAAKSATDYTSGIYGLTFRSTAAFSGFKGVQVDGRTIAAANYVAEDNGGIEVYLKAVYLRTLKDGRHTVTILSDAGNVTMNFTIGGVDSPTTFDAGIGAYVGMALASVGGMAWMRRRKR